MKAQRLLVLLTLAVTVLLASGCKTLPQQSFNREANASIKQIKVLSIRKQDLRLFVLNHPGYNFGLIGMLVTEANRAGKENWLQDTATASGFDHYALFRTALDAAMAEKGYELQWHEPMLDEGGRRIKRSSDTGGLRVHYPKVEADAQLDISLSYVGYAAAGTGAGEPYRPTVEMMVRLMDSTGKEVLFVDQIVYHNVSGSTRAIVLEPHPDYAYPKFDDLESAGETVVEGLRIAVDEIARALAEQL